MKKIKQQQAITNDDANKLEEIEEGAEPATPADGIGNLVVPSKNSLTQKPRLGLKNPNSIFANTPGRNRSLSPFGFRGKLASPAKTKAKIVVPNLPRRNSFFQKIGLLR